MTKILKYFLVTFNLNYYKTLSFVDPNNLDPVTNLPIRCTFDSPDELIDNFLIYYQEKYHDSFTLFQVFGEITAGI